MNTKLIKVTDPLRVNHCDRCGDLIDHGEYHFTTADGELILCATCAHNTKE